MTSLSAQSAWNRERVTSFLNDYRAPMRLSVLDESDFPLICSLWFSYRDGRLLCATTRNAKVVRCLEANPKCGFEIAPNEPPYHGVRGRGRASISTDGAIDLLSHLVGRYLGDRDTKFARWLIERPTEEVVLSVGIEWMTSWDFTARMSE